MKTTRLKHEAMWISITTTPYAECVTEGCTWAYTKAKASDCKAHVRATGHEVVRTTKTVDKYYPDLSTGN